MSVARKRTSRAKSAGGSERRDENSTPPPEVDIEKVKAELDLESSTWAPVDLEPILAGRQTAVPPSILARQDGPCLLYRGKLHSLYGEPEAGKGWVALRAAVEQLQAGEGVVYIDFEDDAETAVERLRALGAEPDAILDWFRYLRPDQPLTGELSRADLEIALAPEPSLVVIDGVTEALAIEGIDLNNNTDVANWIVMFPRRIARDTGAAVVLIDHLAKASDARGRYAIGAQHKLAGIHVAYSIKAEKPFGRGLNGSSRIKVEKDRPGHVRRHAATDRTVAEMTFESDPDSGAVTLELRPSEGWRPDEVMVDISVRLEGNPKGMSRQALVNSLGRREKTVDAAIRLLRDEGYIRVEAAGPGKPTVHSHVKPYRQPVEEGSK